MNSIRQLKLEIKTLERQLVARRKALACLEEADGEATHPPAEANADGKPKRVRRKPAVIDFLKSNGATLRKDILATMNIPQGTLDSILNDKEVFTQDEYGRWSVKTLKVA